ncbi:hypothetical protein V6N13_111630 [Hibiscus sabdariffa]
MCREHLLFLPTLSSSKESSGSCTAAILRNVDSGITNCGHRQSYRPDSVTIQATDERIGDPEPTKSLIRGPSSSTQPLTEFRHPTGGVN